ncbi:hypothetical protein LCGC14_2574750 [marine sediment metagenome]|uniref:Uncharacterized protein n=1 Tax=marine sediment metagenome TaxID=412755 RepID=A0A0F9D8Y9_9ZZZZ
MPWESQFEREEESIFEAEANGEITAKEARKQHQELMREWRESADESAREAYDREMERW